MESVCSNAKSSDERLGRSANSPFFTSVMSGAPSCIIRGRRRVN